MSPRVLAAGAALAVAAVHAASAQHDMHEQSTAHEMGAGRVLFTQIDRLEGRWPEDGGDATLFWDAQGWYGGDINKLWWKTEGDAAGGDVEEAEVQLLVSRAVTPFLDLQVGVRQDLEPDSLTYGVLGVQGLAPYWFEIDVAAFVNGAGEVTARVEAEYELLLTQRLILQPRAEAEFALQDVAERNLGAGVSSVDVGLRLRYEVRREFAPYIGVEWSRALGETAAFRRAAGEPDETIAVVAGLRLWF